MSKIQWIVLAALAFVISCGTTSQSFFGEDPELENLLKGEDYAALTVADKYEVAEYLMRKGDVEKARAIYEDIVTYNPGLIPIKYKLAKIYLSSGELTFTGKDEDGKNIHFTKNGKELGEAVLREIIEQDPSYLPAYSELIVVRMAAQDTQQASQLYHQVSGLDKTYISADYRVGYLEMLNESNASRFEDGIKAMRLGQKTYNDLYTSYKNLANIQKVQDLDTLAYQSYLKALEYRTEAADLFSVYHELADVCVKIWHNKKDESYKMLALEYACTSMDYFADYEPSVVLIKELTNIQPGVDTASTDTVSAYKAAARDYCSSIGKSKTSVAGDKGTVIPKSYLRETLVPRGERGKRKTSASNTKWVVGGAIAMTAVGAAVLLGSSGGSGNSNSGLGAPPTFPNP
ncbi:hypothetical protein K1X84_12625 [bacterium]|nr:hypothetical protein [bacterium]